MNSNNDSNDDLAKRLDNIENILYALLDHLGLTYTECPYCKKMVACKMKRCNCFLCDNKNYSCKKCISKYGDNFLCTKCKK
jgi:hypothetical protein